MAASDPVGNVSKMILVSKEESGDEHSTTISNRLLINPEVTYQQVDTVSRALIGMSKDSYYDTLLVTNISVTEVIAEG